MTLDDLIALNDEILALARAGVPIGQGLLRCGRGLPRRLRDIRSRIGSELEQGKPLEAAFEAHREMFPSAYRALVVAGIRSGSLTSALEGMAETLRRMAELRRLVARSFAYPLLVVVLASGLFVSFLQPVLGPLGEAFTVHRVHPPPWITVLIAVADQVSPWLLGLPVVLILAAVVWWLWTGRTRMLDSSAGMLPFGASILADGRRGTFIDVLALLVEHKVAMEEALGLAAEVCGDRRIGRDAERIAGDLDRGHVAPWRSATRRGIPPMVRWLASSESASRHLAKSLKRLAHQYVERAERRALWWRTYLPLGATIGIGGITTAAYVFVFLGPWFTFLVGLVRDLD
jgi:general secretion pathway protein F